MRTAVRTLLAIATMMGFALSNATAQIPWQDNLRTAHAQAQAQGKLLLLHFYSDNCVWCERLEAGSFQDASVASAISRNFVPVKVHAAKNPKLTEMFHVSKYPTDVIVTTDGKTLAHNVSPQQPARYVAMLSGVASAAPTVARAPTASPETQAKVSSPPSTMTAPGTPSYVKSNPLATVSPTGTAPSSVSSPTAPAATETSTAKTQTGQFTLPSGNPSGGTQAQLAAARTDSGGLALPQQTPVEPESQAAPAVQEEAKPAASPSPELAMEGYCPVTVIKEDRWVEGNPKFGVIHLGKLYLFSDAGKMQTFLADPVPYTPVLNEIDVVRFFEERVIVPGKREWGLKDPTYNRMFFFADEKAMNHFWNEYERYTGAAIEVMEKAIKDANPGT